MIRFILFAILIVFGNATNPVQNDNFQVKRMEQRNVEKRTMLQKRAQQHLKGRKIQQNDNFQVKRMEQRNVERRTMLQKRAQQHLKGRKIQQKQMLESRIHSLENRYAQIKKMENTVPERKKQRYTLQGEHLFNTISKIKIKMRKDKDA